LRSNYHVWVCLCGRNSSNSISSSSSSSSGLLLGTHSTAMTRKKLVHVRKRMNKWEKEKKEKRGREGERPVYSTTDVLLHLYYINHHVKDAPPARRIEGRNGQGLNRLWIKQSSQRKLCMITFFYILFVFYIMEKKVIIIG
jgi:hypothetical protein